MQNLPHHYKANAREGVASGLAKKLEEPAFAATPALNYDISSYFQEKSTNLALGLLLGH
jgi:hypothetical protein